MPASDGSPTSGTIATGCSRRDAASPAAPSPAPPARPPRPPGKNPLPEQPPPRDAGLSRPACPRSRPHWSPPAAKPAPRVSTPPRWAPRRPPAVLRRTQSTDERLQSSQLAQLRASAASLNQSLELARASLDSLNLRAPVAGQLDRNYFAAVLGYFVRSGWLAAPVEGQRGRA